MKHHSEKHSNLSPLPNCRFLKIGETVQEGDSLYTGGTGPWEPADKHIIGATVQNFHLPFCRPIQIQKEKLVLEIHRTYPKDIRFDGSSLVAFKISNQSGFEFDKQYKATNGIVIESAYTPAFSGSNFFIQGRFIEENNVVILVTVDQYAKIREAVKEILARENAPPKILKRITFKYGPLKERHVIDVTEDGKNVCWGIDVDTKKVWSFDRKEMFEVENVVKNS